MYFTANGRALPCCIAPFSQHGYENYTLGDATQQTLREIWNGSAYREFRNAYCPTNRRRLRQLRPALEPVSTVTHESNAVRATGQRPVVISAVIPCLDEEAAIARVVTSVLAQDVREVVVVDGGSRDRTVSEATGAGARVIVEPQHGYGRAIQAGIAAVRKDAEILVFLDGDGSDLSRIHSRSGVADYRGTGRLRSRLARSWVA